MKESAKKGGLKATLLKYSKRYFIDAMGAMANGLFASLLMGTIIKTLGQQLGNLLAGTPWQVITDALVQIGDFACAADGCAMAMAIASSEPVSTSRIIFSGAMVSSPYALFCLLYHPAEQK